MSFIIELSFPDSVSVCRKNGAEISKRSTLYTDLLDCTSSGDSEDACRYVIEQHKPEFRVVKRFDGNYRNVLASSQDLAEICRSIYFDSDSDFTNEDIAKLYLVWQAAHDVCER